MNPFEAARLEATKLRHELESKGVDLNQGGFAIVTSACKALDIALKQVKPEMALLKSADATILVDRKWTLVRKDVPDEIKAFLVAHEIGHFRLHPTTTGSGEVSQSALTGETESNGVSVVESYGARERQELQANVFAREFLLPRRDARDAFLDHKQSATGLAGLRQLPLELVRLQLYDGILLPHVDKPAKVFRLPDEPTSAQKPAVDSDAPVSLVEAGPGTGKTTALLLRLRRLIRSGVSPDEIVILTFSNKAARELVERARAGNIPGADRVWIGTFHAFGLEFLRKFGHLHGLDARFPVLDKLASLAMLEQDVPNAELQFHDALSKPSWLESIVDAIRRSKDEVFDATKFADAVTTSPTGKADTDGKLRDAATIFKRYEQLLAKRKAVDLTDLLCVSIRLIMSGDPAVERFLGDIRHLMVDEYQDVNRASALLVRGLSKECRTVWVVGDANQAIYAFMGASSSNLANFQKDFPRAISIPLALNHRSSQEIADAFGEVAARNPAGRATTKLKTEKGYVGHGPRHIQTSDVAEQFRALAWRIRDLESNHEILLAEQAIITYQNAVAADIAAGLESLGVPVLFLGNIFDRGEIKDLICLFMLALDDAGINLLRNWHAPCLAMSKEGVDLLLSRVVLEKTSWKQVSGEGLSPEDTAALQNLRRLCSLMEENTSPWDALSSILLEDGQWLRDLATMPGQAAANSLMAIWQFVHFCRTPDGTGRWATVKSLPQRVRDRVRLNEDRSMRSVPPEAEGMNAIRVLTAHGSKGLEFDAVHFVDVKDTTYAPSRRPNTNYHIPSAVLDATKSLDVHRSERHNLLYVAISRPRFFLTVYTTEDQQLPPALSGLVKQLDGAWERPEKTTTSDADEAKEAEVSLEDFLEFRSCSRQSEMSGRGGRWQREELKVHRAIDSASRRALRELADDPSLLQGEQWRACVDEAINHFHLNEHNAAKLIRQRVEQRVLQGRNWLSEGGTGAPPLTVTLGLLKVGLQPDQVLQLKGIKTLRFIRADERKLDAVKQPLAALLNIHHAKGGERIAIQVATLADGRVTPIGSVKADTPPKYEAIAHDLCAGNFSGIPSSGRVCHTCPYMFPCSKRPAEDD
jgi:superfamily I DNA/RNA helicase